MSKFDPEKLPGRDTEAAAYWRASARSFEIHARNFRERAEAAEERLGKRVKVAEWWEIRDRLRPHPFSSLRVSNLAGGRYEIRSARREDPGADLVLVHVTRYRRSK